MNFASLASSLPKTSQAAVSGDLLEQAEALFTQYSSQLGSASETHIIQTLGQSYEALLELWQQYERSQQASDQWVRLDGTGSVY